ncbi:ATP-dependent DNA helicase [Agrocybe pediades]|nr:ATP-dependent DNA helicase [Agrocybe pediades]
MYPSSDSEAEPNVAEPSSSAVTHARIATKTRRQLRPADSEDCMRILTQVFGHSSFKGKQKEIVEAAYGGADVLVVAPTGMGKSLCFQVPAIADKRGLTVVVSPLLALMENQIESLRSKNVEVAALSSEVKPAEQIEICREIQLYETRTKLLYVTPERLCTADFMKILDVIHENHNLNRLVVDEAHCISEWGHDFRAEYRKIGNFRNRYPDIPIMALTATATPAVQRDMVRNLKLVEKHLYIALHPFNRENLFYEVRYLSNPDQLNQMADIFDTITTFYRRRGRASSGIVYCRYRKTCDEISSYLRGKGLSARPYHRGVPSATLKKTLQEWTRGEGVDVVVATIAFGLGIDKGDVRYIIHYDLPKSFEGYYQETGRAGRDGNPSRCILYYSREDAIRVKNFIRSSNPNRVREEEDDEPTPTQRASGSQHSLVDYAENSTICRHVLICKYFGEDIDEEDPATVKAYCDNMCDVCKSPEKVRQRILKLSSKQEAAANVPPRTTTTLVNNAQASNTNPAAPPGRIGKFDDQQALRRGSVLGSTKRFNMDLGESLSVAKKAKVAALPPMMVTRPHASASLLAKPFKTPSFMSKTSVASLKPRSPSPPPAITKVATLKEPPRDPVSRPSTSAVVREQVVRKASEKAPQVQEEVEAEESDGDEVNLPETRLRWFPDETTKVSIVDREERFNVLRRKLHKVLFMHIASEAIWDKISEDFEDEKKRNEVVFKTAADLEQTAISLSSTENGYNVRVQAIRGDIGGLTELHLWDSGKGVFEDRQEVVDMLRRYAKSVGKK